MSAPAYRVETLTARSDSKATWAAIGFGLAAMYLPVYWWASTSIWQSDEHAHGPIVLAVALWLFWRMRHQLAALPPRGNVAVGAPIFAAGVLCYVTGRVVGISILDFASVPIVLAGGLVLTLGTRALRLAWFPVLYLIFMVPLPGAFVDAVTGPLKQWISVIVESILYAAGYPIARTGVVLSIGQYQLLIADACSGLNSMFSLSALGTVFMYLMGRAGKLHNVVMMASILPIAFVANIIRVIVLVLVTYYLGDEAGQGFLHGAAGMVLMLVALVSFMALDSLLLFALRPRAGQAARK